LEREEGIAKPRKSLDGAIKAKIVNLSAKIGKNSLEEATANAIAKGKYLY
jgi:hypothetical protein